jgi:hypothetical protein
LEYNEDKETVPQMQKTCILIIGRRHYYTMTSAAAAAKSPKDDDTNYAPLITCAMMF